MNHPNLNKLSASALVQQFVLIALKQNEALLDGDPSTYNHLFGQMDLISRELKRRPGDQRRALIYLLEHPNAQVRLTSAIATLSLAGAEARHTLQIISDRDEYPQAPYARDMIAALEKGRIVPD